MGKSHYLPRTDQERVVWLNNFSAKFAVYAATFGMASEVAGVAKDAAMFAYTVAMVETSTTTKEQWVDFKNLMRNGTPTQLAVPVIAPPPLPAAPAAVQAGIFTRAGQQVQRIKNNPNYTEAIGKDLGIIGSEQLAISSVEMKPVLKLVMKGGQVEIQWVKGDADALYIETDKGTGWQFLAVDTVPHYTDTTRIAAASSWKYRAMYLVNDEKVGQWSDVASIAVG
ncbi:MAG TPA: hypothetical protein VL728_11745 [Cyclobacteriaceae bacterium]|nr:hypothetical protein [Cyclobacteriaceae bacterium]